MLQYQIQQNAKFYTDSFINAYQRFISRRGKSNTIMSDCGPNFKGIVKELKLELSSLNQKRQQNLLKNRILYENLILRAHHI